MHQSENLCAARTLLGFLFYVPCQRWMSINVQVRRACLAAAILLHCLLSALPERGVVPLQLGPCPLTSHRILQLDVL